MILFFDGKTLVRIHFNGNPLSTSPEVHIVEHGQEVPDSMRQVVLQTICHGMDMKQQNWI